MTLNVEPAEPTPEDLKAWIDAATYEQLLRRWRFSPPGDPAFRDRMGDYYAYVMAKRRAEVGNAEHVATSKRIGWEP